MVKFLFLIGMLKIMIMNMLNKLFTFLFVAFLIVTSETSMAFFLNNELNSDDFLELIQKNTSSNTYKIENITIKGFKLPTKQYKNIHFINNTWENINAEDIHLENIEFHNCSFENINLKNSTLINVNFNNCTLTNVTLNYSQIKNLKFTKTKLISTDPNIKNSYRELNADTITFVESELNNINFFDSKAEFSFIDSQLNDVTGLGLMPGSSLIFNNTNAVDIDFSSSTLKRMEVKRSHIKQSKANNCTIEKLILEESTLDFPISQGNKYGSVTSYNTGNVVVSGTPTKSTLISSCPKDTRIIMVGGDEFEKIEISDCSPDEIIFFKSKGKYVSIENADVYTMDFTLSKIDHLKLNNVHIKTQLYYDASNIKKLEATNISFGENIEHTHEESNIEIKADKKLTNAQ